MPGDPAMVRAPKSDEKCRRMMIRKLYPVRTFSRRAGSSCAEHEHADNGADLRRLALRGSRRQPGSGGFAEVQPANARVLKGLAAQHAIAIGFVNEIILNVHKERDACAAVPRQWLDAGIDLGNDNYSHPALSNVGTAKHSIKTTSCRDGDHLGGDAGGGKEGEVFPLSIP